MTAVQVPRLVGVGTAALVFALGVPSDAGSSPSGDVAVPEQLAGYSHLTGSVSDSPPGAAVALFQHGFGVEFLDFPQAVVLGAGGDAYRRVDVAEGRAGAETQGDPAPMLLSPDGTKVAVGDHDIDRPDVVIVDLTTGTTSRHVLPTGRSVVPIAWSSDGQRLAHVLSAAPTNPHSGEPIVGDVGLLDLEGGGTSLLQHGGQARTAAFSPDGSALALQQDGAGGEQLAVVDLASGSRRGLESAGVLAGPAAWSPDGRLLATTTVRSLAVPAGVPVPTAPTGLAFIDATGRHGDALPPLELPLAPQGDVLGWSGPDEVLTLMTDASTDQCCGPEAYQLAAVPISGGRPRTLMQIPDLPSFGVSRFQLAHATVDDLSVVTPVDVDRGEWPLPLRAGLAILLGLIAWAATRLVVRRTRAHSTRRHTDPAQVWDGHALPGP
jgi:dipeptidyl aminopeptidase/acylaminoacyl peptidase